MSNSNRQCIMSVYDCEQDLLPLPTHRATIIINKGLAVLFSELCAQSRVDACICIFAAVL